jgi:hypothetical protein
VPFPVHDEQVGKGGLGVPPSAVVPGGEALKATLRRGDVLYVPRGFVHEARTSDGASSLHLTLALPSASWSWGELIAAAVHDKSVPAAASQRMGPTNGAADGAALLRKLRSCEQTERGPWFWRRSAPPVLGCPDGLGATSGGGQEAARSLAATVEVEFGLRPPAGPTNDVKAKGILESLLVSRAAVHNKRQDDAAREGITLAAAAPPMASPSAWVRRKASCSRAAIGDKDSEAAEGSEGGLLARAEIAESLLATLAATGSEPRRVADFDDCPLLCDFCKACFAQVCVDRGLLVFVGADLTHADVPAEIVEAVAKFEGALCDIEPLVQQILSQPWSRTCTSETSPLDSARLHLTVAYTVNSLYWMLLRTRGATVQNHPVRAELERIKKCLRKVKDAETRAATATATANTGGRSLTVEQSHSRELMPPPGQRQRLGPMNASPHDGKPEDEAMVTQRQSKLNTAAVQRFVASTLGGVAK